MLIFVLHQLGRARALGWRIRLVSSIRFDLEVRMHHFLRFWGFRVLAGETLLAFLLVGVVGMELLVCCSVISQTFCIVDFNFCLHVSCDPVAELISLILGEILEPLCLRFLLPFWPIWHCLEASARF